MYYSRMPRPDDENNLISAPLSLNQERGSNRFKVNLGIIIVGVSVFSMGILGIIPKEPAILGLGISVIAATIGYPRHRWDY